MKPTCLEFKLICFALTVSWPWSGGRPSGEVVEKKTEGELSIQSKKGNTIKKNASTDNPALHIGRPGNDVVKRQSELDVEEKAAGGAAEENKKVENGTETKTGEKREREEDVAAPEGEADAKKAKTATPAKARGRPKKGEEKPKASPAKKPTAAEKKTAAAADKKEAAAEMEDEATAGLKKARGRPKKSEGEKKATGPKKEKKTRTPATTDGVGSRTRSKKT